MLTISSTPASGYSKGAPKFTVLAGSTTFNGDSTEMTLTGAISIQANFSSPLIFYGTALKINCPR